MNIEQNDAIIEMVKKYLEHLPEHKIYNIITMMQSDKFKRFWDSDQHTDEENWAELQNNRVRDLFEVLRNETGINYIFNANRRGLFNPFIYEKEEWKSKRSGKGTINYYLK